MKCRYKEHIAIIKHHLQNELPVKDIDKTKELTLQELQTLQYKEHLKLMQPIVYRKQE